MKSFINLLLVFILFTSNSFAQNNKSVQVLVRGIVSDWYDKSPLQVELRFEDPSGKYFKINSNSLTGRYEQVLNSNTKYKVRLFSAEIFPTEFILVTPEVNNYIEIEQNYEVIKLHPGRTVLVYDIFSFANSELNSNLNKFIEELNVKMRFNRNVKIQIEVCGIDSKSNFTKVIEKKVKKKLTTDTIFEKKEYENLVDKRLKALTEIKPKLAYPDRVSFGFNTMSGLTDKLFDKCPDCDTRIIVLEYDPAIK